MALSAFLALAAQCTPMTPDGRLVVAPETLAAVAWTESRLGALRVGINEPGARAPVFSSLAAATVWVTANAHRSLDIGLAQINTRAGHMQRRGLPVAAALDPCVGIRVGAEVLAGCYRTAPAVEEQRRIRFAAACYNTGRHNEAVPYVQRVQASAELVVPAIRLRGEMALPAPTARPLVRKLPPDDAACGAGHTRKPGIAPQMVLLDDDDCIHAAPPAPAAPAPAPYPDETGNSGGLDTDAPPARIAVTTDRPRILDETAGAASTLAATVVE